VAVVQKPAAEMSTDEASPASDTDVHTRGS
jgi:hypothetical protein